MLTKKQILETLENDSMPSFIVNELDIELRKKLENQYPDKKNEISLINYEPQSQNLAVINNNDIDTKIKFKLNDYKNTEEFMFYLKNSQKEVIITNYEIQYIYEGMIIEENDIYKSILNDNEKNDTLLVMKAKPFTEKDNLNIKVKIDGKYKEIKLSRKSNDSKKEMKFIYEDQFIKITVLIDREIKYISWNFHHLFNNVEGHAKVKDIIATYKILISLSNGEIYTDNGTKFNHDIKKQNKEVITSLKSDLKLFEIINDFQLALDKTFEIETPFNDQKILDCVKLYLMLYDGKILLEEKHLDSLVIKTNSFDLEDIKEKKFTLIKEDEVTKKIFNEEISYVQYQCYSKLESTNYYKIESDAFKLKFNPSDLITTAYKATFTAIEPKNLEEMTLENADTIDTLIKNYTPKQL